MQYLLRSRSGRPPIIEEACSGIQITRLGTTPGGYAGHFGKTCPVRNEVTPDVTGRLLNYRDKPAQSGQRELLEPQVLWCGLLSLSHDTDMSRRTAGWIGCAVTGGVVVGLIAYFAAVGLAKADEVATAVGAPIALVALAVGIWGLFPRASSSANGQAGGGAQNVTAGRDAYVAGGDVTVNQPPTQSGP